MNNSLIINRLVILLFFFPVFLYSQNSTCSDAIIVEEGEFIIENFSGSGAIFQGATSAAWYRYEPTEKGVFKISSCGGGGDSRLVLMLLDDCSKQEEFQILNSVEDNCLDGNGGETASMIESVATPGFSYVIYWDDGQSADGFTWSLTFSSDTETLAGGTCETAIEIEKGMHTVDTLVGVGAAFSDAVSAKWYKFIAPDDVYLFTSACESTVDTRLFVFEGSCGENQIIGQDENSCGDTGASLINGDGVIVQQNQAYYLYWDDHSSRTGFNFELGFTPIESKIVEPEWAKNILVYPNPAENQLFVDYSFAKNLDLQVGIFNNLGQKLYTENWRAFQNGQVNIRTDNYPEGIYFLELATANERMTRKFVIK